MHAGIYRSQLQVQHCAARLLGGHRPVGGRVQEEACSDSGGQWGAVQNNQLPTGDRQALHPRQCMPTPILVLLTDSLIASLTHSLTHSLSPLTL